MINIEQFLEQIFPINSNEKVDKIIKEFRTGHIRLTKNIDMTIRRYIWPLSVYHYYSDCIKKYKQKSAPTIIPTKKKERKTESKPPLLSARKSSKKSKRKKPIKEGYGENKLNKSSRFRKLVENGRDYSPTDYQKKLKKSVEQRSESEKERAEWIRRAHIIYTPMGGQNKKY